MFLTGFLLPVVVRGGENRDGRPPECLEASFRRGPPSPGMIVRQSVLKTHFDVSSGVIVVRSIISG